MTTKVTLIGDGAVNSSAILNTTIKTEDIENNAVTSDKLQSGGNNNDRAVSTNHIKDKAVTPDKLADDVSAYLSFPLGGIVMWSGTIAQIPPGWYLCDGETYGGLKTPDLRNKFIVGASTGTGDTTYPGVSIGAEGGSANAIIPYHNHGINDTGHSHQLYNQIGGPGNSVGGGGSNTSDQQTGSQTTGITVNYAGTEGNTTNANLPPYYALAYIMKCEFRAGSFTSFTTTTPTLQELRLNGPFYDQTSQKGNAGDLLTSLGGGNGVRWSSDGVTNSQFTGSNQDFVGTSGYQKLPGGLIMQWGTSSSLGEGSQIQTFATAFTSSVFTVQVTPRSGGGNAGNKRDHWVANNWTLNGFTLTSYFENGSASYSWLAIGV